MSPELLLHFYFFGMIKIQHATKHLKLKEILFLASYIWVGENRKGLGFDLDL